MILGGKPVQHSDTGSGMELAYHNYALWRQNVLRTAGWPINVPISHHF